MDGLNCNFTDRPSHAHESAFKLPLPGSTQLQRDVAMKWFQLTMLYITERLTWLIQFSTSYVYGDITITITLTITITITIYYDQFVSRQSGDQGGFFT